MRKIIWFNLITLDGFFEGPNREIDWHNVDNEFNEFAIEQLDSLDTLLFGRVTYEMMASYWPTEMAVTDDPVVAGKMNGISKIVYSTKLKKANWSNSSLVDKNIIEQTARLKGQPGRDMAIFGSGELGNTLLKAGLVDEIRIMINPILLGEGRPMFKDGKERQKLKLLSSRTFHNGNVLLYYQPGTNGGSA
jgi:dihydrofolate reductase